jgi:hypothetical protein
VPALFRLALVGCVGSALVACGARSGLFGLESDDEVIPGPALDGGTSTTPSPPPDGATREAATADARHDEAAAVDAAPSPVPAPLPPIDASVADADLTGCTADTPTAYLVSEDQEVLRFDPPSMIATSLGFTTCPAANSSPYVMTASRAGTLYVLYTDWSLYAVDPQTLTCTKTAWVAGQLGFPGDVGIAVSRTRGAEALYVLGAQGGKSTLARSDLDTFALTKVGLVTPAPSGYPLDFQADVYDRLFGLSQSGLLAQIDPATAQLIGEDPIPGFSPKTSWSLLAWGREVYAFTGARAEGSTVLRYDLTSKKVTASAHVAASIVGASAPPCTP